MPIVRTAAVMPAQSAGVGSPASLLRVHPGVRPEQVVDALNALAQVPLADRILLARSGLAVDLMPDARFEQDMVGATQVEKDAGGVWRPQSIRVAAGAGLPNSPTRHIVAHEVGHAIAVLRSQDRSELAAEQYCMRVLTSPADQAIGAARMRAEGMNTAGVAARAGVAAAALAACLLKR